MKGKKERKKEKTYLTSDIVWACLLHEVAVVVVARSVGGVWMGDDRVVMAVERGRRQRRREW